MAGLFTRRFFSSSSTAPPAASTDDDTAAAAGADIDRPTSPGEPQTFHDSSESQDGRASLESPTSNHSGGIIHSKVRAAPASGLASHTTTTTTAMSNSGSPRSASHIQRELELLRQNILSRLDSDDESVEKDAPDPSKQGLALHQDELHGLRRQRDEADEAMRDAKRKLAVAEASAAKHINALKDLEGRHTRLLSDNAREKTNLQDRIANLEKTRLDAKESDRLKAEAETLKTQVDNLKSTHAAELGALTKQHQESQDRVKTLQAESTQAAQQNRKLQEDHQASNTARDQEAKRLQATHEQALTQIKADHGAQLHAKTVEAQRTILGHQETLKAKDAEHQSALKKKTDDHEAALNAKDSEHQSTLKKKVDDYEAALKAKDGEHQTVLKTKDSEHQNALKSQNDQHEAALKAKDTDHASKAAELKSSHEATLKAKVQELEQAATSKLTALRAELEKSHQAKVDELTTKHRTDINTRKQSHRVALQDFERRLKETIQYNEAAMAELEAKATQAETQLERERKKSTGPNLVGEGAAAGAVAGVAGGALAADIKEATKRNDSDIAPDEVPSQTTAVGGVAPIEQQAAKAEPIAEAGKVERATSTNIAPTKSTRNFFRRKPVANTGDADSIASGADGKSKKGGLFRKTSLMDQYRLADVQQTAEKRLQEQKQHYEALLEETKREAKVKLEEYEKLVHKHTATNGKAPDNADQHEVEKKLVEAKGSVVASLEAQHAHATTAGAISTERAEADIKQSANTGGLGEKSAADAGEKIKEQKEHYEKLLVETKKAANAKIDEAFAWCEKQLASSRASGHAPSGSVDAKQVPARTSSKRPNSGVFYAGVAGTDDSKQVTQLQEDKQQLEKKLKEQQEQHQKRTTDLQQEADKKLADTSAKYEEQLKQLQAKVTAASSTKNSGESKKLAEELSKQKKEHDDEVRLIKRQSNAKLDEAFKHYEGLIAAAENKSKEQGATQKDADNVKQLKKQLDDLKKSNDDKLKAQSAEYEKKLSEVERTGSIRRSSSRSSFFRRRFGRRNGDDESEAGGSRPASQAGSVAGPEQAGRASTVTAATGFSAVPEETLKSLQKELKETKVAANTKLDQAFAYYEKRLQTEREEANERIKQLEERHRTSSTAAA